MCQPSASSAIDPKTMPPTLAATAPIAERTLYSIGGGFTVDEDEAFVGSPRGGEATVPYPFASMAELLLHGKRERLPLMDLLRANEHALRGTAATTSFLDRVIDTFFTCIDRGIATRGELPGGLNVKRRAPDIHHQLTVERGQRQGQSPRPGAGPHHGVDGGGLTRAEPGSADVYRIGPAVDRRYSAFHIFGRS